MGPIEMDFKFESYNRDEIKKMYDEFYSTRDFKHFSIAEKYFIKSLVKRNEIKKGTKIIDLGCGTGKYTHYFTSIGMDAIGVDISEQGIDIARRRSPASKFLVGDITNLDFEPGTFGVVFCSGLSFFNEPNLDILVPLVSSFFSLLKRNGFFIFVKTTSLTNKYSRNKGRLDYSIKSYLDFFKRIEKAAILNASGTYPHVFPVLGRMGFLKLITGLSVFCTKVTGIPLRVCIILKYNG